MELCGDSNGEVETLVLEWSGLFHLILDGALLERRRALGSYHGGCLDARGQSLIELGFELVCNINLIKLFRKRA